VRAWLPAKNKIVAAASNALDAGSGKAQWSAALHDVRKGLEAIR
jgi:hypothetical protein